MVVVMNAAVAVGVAVPPPPTLLLAEVLGEEEAEGEGVTPWVTVSEAVGLREGMEGVGWEVAEVLPLPPASSAEVSLGKLVMLGEALPEFNALPVAPPSPPQGEEVPGGKGEGERPLDAVGWEDWEGEAEREERGVEVVLGLPTVLVTVGEWEEEKDMVGEWVVDEVGVREAKEVLVPPPPFSPSPREVEEEVGEGREVSEGKCGEAEEVVEGDREGLGEEVEDSVGRADLVEEGEPVPPSPPPPAEGLGLGVVERVGSRGVAVEFQTLAVAVPNFRVVEEGVRVG